MQQNLALAQTAAAPQQMTPQMAVLFWISRIGEMLPNLMDSVQTESIQESMMKKAISGGLPILLKRINNISNEQALEIINAIHNMSYRLEEQTGVLNPNYEAFVD